MAAVSLTWSYSEISASSLLDVEDGTYVRLTSSTSRSELIYPSSYVSTPFKLSLRLSITLI